MRVETTVGCFGHGIKVTSCQTEKHMCESERSEKNCNRELLLEILGMKLISRERILKFTQTDQVTFHWSQESHLGFSQRCVVAAKLF